jgi:hypothetical protein
VPVLTEEQIARIQRIAQDYIEQGQKLIGMGQEILVQIGKAQSKPAIKVERVASPPKVKPTPLPGPVDEDAGAARIKSGALRILHALAQRYPMRLTLAQVATLSRFKKSGGTFGSYISVLRKRGFLDEQDGLFTLSQAALEFLGEDIPPMPQTTRDLLNMWRGALKKGAAEMLDALVEIYPEWMTREQLALVTGKEVTGGAFGSYLSMLKVNGLAVVEGQQVRASDTLFIDEPMLTNGR